MTNLFLFFPDGSIGAMCLNGPGVLHDSTMAIFGEVYDRCKHFYTRFDVRGVVDSAFTTKNADYFIKSAQTPPENGDAEEMLIFQEATSVRQMSEWGMRAFQGSWPRLKDRMLYEERGERSIILQVIARLHNLRANLVGINQIRSIFMPHLDMPIDRFMSFYDA